MLVEKSLPDIVGDLVSGGGEPKPPAIVCLPDRMLACLLHNPDVEYVPLFRSCMGVVGTKDLLSPRKRSMTVAEVARLPIACYNEPILDAILAEMFAAHPFQNVIMHVSNIPLIDEYVQGGRAVTFSDSFSDFLNPNPSGLLFLSLIHICCVPGFPWTCGRLQYRRKGGARSAQHWAHTDATIACGKRPTSPCRKVKAASGDAALKMKKRKKKGGGRSACPQEAPSVQKEGCLRRRARAGG